MLRTAKFACGTLNSQQSCELNVLHSTQKSCNMKIQSRFWINHFSALFVFRFVYTIQLCEALFSLPQGIFSCELRSLFSSALPNLASHRHQLIKHGESGEELRKVCSCGCSGVFDDKRRRFQSAAVIARYEYPMLTARICFRADKNGTSRT